MGRKSKKIKAVLILPDCERAVQKFEKRLSDFYIGKVEQGLLPLQKKEKLEVLDIMISDLSR